jgi:ABC-type sugar transport system ATPase subunit
MSMVYAMVQFNRKFNPSLAPEGDYNVIARGATSLIAKEVRGMQADSFSQTTKPEEMIHVDERKLVKMRLAARDMNDVLVSEAEAKRRQDGKNKTMQEQAELAKKQAEADERKTLADAYKNISQGTKNLSASQAQIVNAALEILQNGLEHKVGADVMDQADQQMQQTMQPQPQMPPDGQGGGMPPEDQGGGMPEGMPPQ